MAYRAIRSTAATLVHLCQLPIDQQAPPLVRQNDVPCTYITMQDLCKIECMRVRFEFVSASCLCIARDKLTLERVEDGCDKLFCAFELEKWMSYDCMHQPVMLIRGDPWPHI